MKKNIYIFCHGFGFNHLFWENLAPYFINEQCIYLNLGYFKEPITNISINSSRYNLIGIGHSLGLIKLLQLDLPFKYLIGINGFIDFLSSDIYIHKKRSIELKALRNSLLKEPQATLTSFYKRCGLTNWKYRFNCLNLNNLLSDLNLLEKAIQLPINIQTCIIFTDNDIIVPKRIIDANFNNKLNVTKILLQYGYHSLGFNYPKTIKIVIDKFLNDKV